MGHFWCTNFCLLDGLLDSPGQRRRQLLSSVWTRNSGGSVGTTNQRKGKEWWEADGHHGLGRERVQGKGSEWRSASRRRPLQTKTMHHGDMPTPPPPLF